MNTIDDLLHIIQKISSLSESNSHFIEGVSRRIEKTGKPVNQLTVSELLNLIKQYREFYNTSLSENIDNTPPQNLSDDETLEEIAKFKPIFTDEEMYQAEENFSNENVGERRRLALLAYSRSFDDLSKLRINKPAAFLEMAEQIEQFKRQIKYLLEIAECADLRMVVANCVDTMHQETKKPNN